MHDSTRILSSFFSRASLGACLRAGVYAGLGTSLACGSAGVSAGSEAESGDESAEGGEDGNVPCEHPPVEGGAPDGSACVSNGDCASNVCALFGDVPVDEDASCEPAPANCATRVTGTVYEFGTTTPAVGVTVKIVGAITASSNPVNPPTVHAQGTTDALGRIDLVTESALAEPLGVVGIVTDDSGGYFLSATGLASPIDSMTSAYAPANAIHDLWVVSGSQLTAWNSALEGDAVIDPSFELGAGGGVIGFVRDSADGSPRAGIEIRSADGDTSDAQIRYLNDAQSAFDATVSSGNGVFIIVDPSLAEDFEAYENGVQVEGATGTAGSTPNSLFVMVMDI